MNKNTYIILAVVAVLLAAGVWFLYGGGASNPTMENSNLNGQDNVQEEGDLPNGEELEQGNDSQNEEGLIDTGGEDSVNNGDDSSERRMLYSVTYTKDGFSPANLSVFEGSTVTFVNNSSRSMWVASDPHPVHTDFPAFDSKQGVAPGETYQFTFTAAGEYSYHNHLSAGHTGNIVAK